MIARPIGPHGRRNERHLRRALASAEWEMFRDFRLAALKASPGVFTTSHDEAAAHAPEQWQATANQRHGFVPTGRVPRTWPDGAAEDEICYELTTGD